MNTKSALSRFKKTASVFFATTLLSSMSWGAPVLNEYATTHSGDGANAEVNEFIEVFGLVAGDVTGPTYTILVINGRFGPGLNPGNVDHVIPVNVQTNGFFVHQFADGTFSNESLTMLLVTGNTAVVNNDVDVANLGAFDNVLWTAIVDDVRVLGTSKFDFTYGTSEELNSTTFPGGRADLASRIPNGTDTNDADDWKRNNTQFANPATPAVADNTPGAGFLGLTNNFSPPPSLDDVIFSLAENAANATVVGTVKANNQIGDLATLAYTITGGNGDGIFGIADVTTDPGGANEEQSGQITVASNTNLDFETTTQYSLTITVTDTGNNKTDTATVVVNITDANDIPVVTASGGNTAYTEAAAAIVIDAALTVVDPDGNFGDDPSTAFTATVQITGNFDTGNDVLAVPATSKISGSQTTDTLTLSVIGGQEATVAEFQAALRTVTFFNNNANLNTGNRTVAFIFNDGTNASNTSNKTIVITPVNDPPVAAITAPGPDNNETVFGTTPTLNFTMSDPENNTASHRVEISTDAGFTGVIISYTSALAALGGSDTFVVGQALTGGDVYNIGDAMTVLVAGTQYWWRVRGEQAGATGAYDTTGPDGTATFTVSEPSLSVSSAADNAASEPGTNTGTYTVTLSGTSNQAITATLSVAGTASTTSGTDYTLAADGGTGFSWLGGPSLTVDFPAGTTSRTITLTPANDAIVEASETATLTTANGTGYTHATTAATVTIADNDGATLTLSSESGNENAGALTFTATLSSAVDATITVQVSTTDGTATTADSDYGAVTNQLLTFVANDTSEIFTVTPTGDTKVEANETFNVSFNTLTTGGRNVTEGIVGVDGTGTITNDDTAAVTIAPTTQASEPSTNGLFTVTMDNVAEVDVLVSYMIGGSATGGSDYTALTGSVSITKGNMQATIDVTVVDDFLLEGDEMVDVTLIAATDNASVTASGSATVTIADNEATLSVTPNSAVKPEGSFGSSPPTAFTFTVTRGGDTRGARSATYTVSGGPTNPAATDDFTSNSFEIGTVIVPDGMTSAPVTINVNGDSIKELNEDFTVTLTAPSPNTTITGTPATGTITDDDLASLAVSSPTLAEDGGNMVFNVTLSGSTDASFMVNFDTGNFGTNQATAVTDYGVVNTVLTFAGTPETKMVNVPITDDSIVEANETFMATVSNAVGAGGLPTFGTQSGSGTINDNDTATLTVGSLMLPETNGATIFAFDVALSSVVEGGVAVNIATADLMTPEALAGSDYTMNSTTLNFDGMGPVNGSGEEIETFNVTVTGDQVVEADEDFDVKLSGVVATTANAIGTTDGTGTITNDDMANFSIDDVGPTAEGDSGSQTFGFTVTLDAAVDIPVTVDFATADVDTTEGVDYVITSGTLNFPVGAPGQTMPISVTVNGDTIVELDEDFTVTLSTAGPMTRNVGIPGGPGTGTIQNDDDAFLTLNSPSVAEDDPGGVLTFTALLDLKVDVDVTVPVTTSDGSATAGSDYTALTAQNVTIAKGTLSKTFDVTIKGDSSAEPDEDFDVNFGAITNVGTLRSVTDATGPPDGVGTILNDDAGLSIAADQPNVNDLDEGTGGGMTAYTFTVSRTGPITGANSATWVASGDTANPATADDFPSGFPSGTVSFAPNVGGTQTITVQVNADSTVELDEGFKVVLTAVSNTGTDIATGTATNIITNDDTTSLTVSNEPITEGDTGSQTLGFTATLTNPVQGGVTFDLSTSDTTASDLSDYVAKGPTPFSFGSETMQNQTGSFDVTINGDTLVEDNETFAVNIGNLATVAGQASVASITTVTDGQGTINDDDSATISITGVTLDEGNSAGTTDFVFDVTLSNAVQGAVVVPFTTVDGTAKVSDSDYVAQTSGSVTFPSGSTAIQQITVMVNRDDVVELDEDFDVDLLSITDPSNGGVTFAGGQATEQATGTITNDDTAVISINNVMQKEPTGGSANFVFMVTLTGVVDNTVTYDFVTSDTGGATATSGVDYTAISSMTSAAFSVNGGATQTQNITVTVLDDVLQEGDETFFVDLSNIQAAGRSVNFTGVSSTGFGTGTILEDDVELAISATDADKVEGNGGGAATQFTFTVTRAGDLSVTTTVNYAVTGSMSLPPADANDFSPSGFPMGTVTFNPNSPSEVISIPVSPDDTLERDEDFIVTLSGQNLASRTVITTATATGIIRNDDSATLSLDQASGSIGSQVNFEGSGGSGGGPINFTASLDNLVDFDVDFTFSTAGGGTATPTTDYPIQTTVAVNIPAGSTSATFGVTPVRDTELEPDETFDITFSGITDGGRNVTDSLPLSATGTILNDDEEVNITPLLSSKNEGNAGDTTDLTFTVARTGLSGTAMGFGTPANTPSVNYTVTGAVPGGGGSAAIANDMTGGTFPSAVAVNFGSAEFSKVITVDVNGDNTVELDEGILVTLASPTAGGGSSLVLDGGASTATGTIVNDDFAILSIDDPMDVEDGGPITFTASLDRQVDVDVTFDAATADDTAKTADSDYGMLPVTAQKITAGMTSTTFTVTPTIDTKVEDDETFFANLSNLLAGGRDVSFDSGMVALSIGGGGKSGKKSIGASVAPPPTTIQGTGTITNDDSATLTVSNVSKLEGDSGPTSFGFTVTLSAAVQGGVTVNVDTADNGSASDASDYTANQGSTLTLSGAAESKPFTVAVAGDNLIEGDETFTVDLSNGMAFGAPILGGDFTLVDTGSGAGVGLGTIQNDDTAPVATADSFTVPEDSINFSLDVIGNAGGGQDSDAESDPLTISAVDIPDSGGAVSIDGTLPNNTLDYSPLGDFFGTETFNYTISDGVFAASALVTVTVTPVNDPPVLDTVNPGITIDEGDVSGLVVSTAALSSSDVDDVDTAITYTLQTTPNSGLTLRNNGGAALVATNTFTQDDLVKDRITVEQNGSQFSSGTFTFSVADDDNAEAVDATAIAPETFTITITNVNDPPVLDTVNPGITIDEDQNPAKVVTTTELSSSDVDDADTAITYTVIQIPNNGATLLINGAPCVQGGGNTFTQQDIVDSLIAIQHNGDQFASSTFTFTVTDFAGAEAVDAPAANPETFTITINNVNDSPVASADSFTVLEDTPTALAVIPNTNPGLADSDVDPGDTLTVTAATSPGSAGGTTVVNPGSPNNTVTFSPLADFNSGSGTNDTFTYTITDGNTGTDSALVTVTITPVNDAPSFTNTGGNQSVAEDSGAQTVTGWATSLSTGPANESLQSFTGFGFNVTNDNNALFSSQPAISVSGTTGNLTYTPAADANGSATVTVSLTDDGGTANFGVNTSGDQMFTITVTPELDAPTITGTVAGQAVNDTATVTPFSGVTIGDLDGDNLTVTVQLDDAAKGVLTPVGGGGQFTDNGGGNYSITGVSPTAATTAIQALTFDPTDNRVASGSTETTTFTITAADGTATADATDNTTTVVSTSVNEAPTDITLAGNSVLQFQLVGTVVGSFSVTDPESSDTHTLTLVTGAGSTDNATFAITGNTLKTAAIINVPTTPLSIRVRATDSGPGALTFDKVFSITVAAPPGNPSITAIPNQVGFPGISSSDASFGPPITFTVSDAIDDDGTLAVTTSPTGNTGLVTIGTVSTKGPGGDGTRTLVILPAANATIGASVSVTVTVTDSNSNTATETFNFTVQTEPTFPVVRTMPDVGYVPAVGFNVKIASTPTVGTQFHAVYDVFVSPWTARGFSHTPSSFSSSDSRVLFGPFQDATMRNLSYWLTPNDTASGLKTFNGLTLLQKAAFLFYGRIEIDRVTVETYAAWDARFGGLGGTGADFSGDGIKNLTDYAMGFNPKANNSASTGLPSTSFNGLPAAETEEGVTYALLYYQRNPAADISTDPQGTMGQSTVRYLIQSSIDGLAINDVSKVWTDQASAIQRYLDDQTPVDTDAWIIKAMVPTGGATNMVLRLVVEEVVIP